MSMRRALIVIAAAMAASCSGSSTAPSPAPSPAPVVAPSPIVPPQPILPVRGPNFDLTFWNEFVHNSFEAPGASQPLRRLTAAPMIALMTIDDAGQAIDSATLSSTESALRDVAPTWGGGQFGLAGVARGTSTMEGVRGWLTVKWAAAATAYCGLSDVGVDGGVMTLFPNTPNCGCPGGVTTSRIRPRTVAHELGHAFGYWHTDNVLDLMRIPSSNCLQSPSEREIYHATIAYGSPVGTVDALPVRGVHSVID